MRNPETEKLFQELISSERHYADLLEKRKTLNAEINAAKQHQAEAFSRFVEQWKQDLSYV